MNERLKRLLASRAKAVETARDHLERAENEGSDLDGEARESWDSAMADVRRLDGEIADERVLVAVEADIQSQAEAFADGPEPRSGDQPSEEEEEFRNFLAGRAGRSRTINFDQRTLNTPPLGTSGEDAVIPETVVRSIWESLRETSIIRELATSITTASGETLTFPRVTGYPTASRVAESAVIPKSQPTFTKASLGSGKYGFISQAATEFITDSTVDIVPLLTAQGRVALFEAQAQDWMVGTGGADVPLGIFPGATTVKAAAAASAVAFDELLDLKYALRPAYRRNGLYVVSDASVAALAKVKDADNRYAWKVSGREGEPDTIHGKRVAVDPYAPEIGAGNRSVAFVAPDRAYLIRDVGEVRIDRSDDYAFDTDEVAWRFLVRSDGGVWDENALAVLEHPAA